MNRLPTILLIVAVLVGLVFVDRSGGDSAVSESAMDVGGPVGRAGVDEGSTWYCAAGFATPDGANDHLVILTNESEQPVRGSLTLFPSLLDTLGNPVPFERAVQPVEIAAQGQQVVALSSVVATLDPLLSTPTGSFVGALAEFEAGGVSVQHAMVTPAGQDQAPCATSAGTSWWFASGTTTNSVSYQLYLLNPFPDDAVVDITFLTDGGARTPSAFTGRLIPSQSLTMLDLAPSFAPWDQVTAEITTRTGRVVAERIQLFRNDEGPVGLSLTPGTNVLSEQWFFPAGNAGAGAAESFVIFNPNPEPAEVEFELKPDSADRAGDIAPLGVSMGPNERWVVNVSLHPNHPVDTVATLDATTVAARGERFFVSIRSFNGVPVVAERLLTRPVELGVGVSTSFGVTRSSTDQVLAIPPWFVPGAPEDASVVRQGELAVLNPAGNTIARVDVLAGGQNGIVLRERAELAPRRRASFDLNTLLEPGDEWIRIESSAGVMAELVVAPAGSIASTATVPDAGTVSTPDLLSFD